MNKRTFTLEIELPERYENGLSEAFIKANIQRAIEHLNPCLWSDEYVVGVVEQSVERPSNKTIQLLEKAERALSDSEFYSDRCFAREIEKHLEKLWGKD